MKNPIPTPVVAAIGVVVVVFLALVGWHFLSGPGTIELPKNAAVKGGKMGLAPAAGAAAPSQN